MKKILVAIDFSPSSLNAFAHAISLAEKFKSEIILLWNETKDSLRELNLKGNENFEASIKQKLADLFAENKSNIPYEVVLTKGATYKEVIDASLKHEVELIVTGNHGTHGVRRFFMGDNANKIIALAKCPVLTVQLHRSITKDLKNIVIAIDNSLETRQKVPITATIAAAFGAQVHILGMYTSSVSTMKMRVDSYVKQAFAGFRTKGIKTQVSFMKTSNISRSTINYAKQIDANLIVTMVETESFTSDVFLGSQGQQLVNQSNIPVLSFHNREIIKTRPGI